MYIPPSLTIRLLQSVCYLVDNAFKLAPQCYEPEKPFRTSVKSQQAQCIFTHISPTKLPSGNFSLITKGTELELRPSSPHRYSTSNYSPDPGISDYNMFST